MKILFVHEVSYTTKVIFEMHEIPELLAHRGHDVHFLDFREEGVNSNRRIPFRARLNLIDTSQIDGRVVKNARVNLHTLRSLVPGMFGRLVAAVASTIRMTAWIRRIQPDIVVTYAVATNGWQAVRSCRYLGIPVVYRAIDLVPDLRQTLFRPLVLGAHRYVSQNASRVLANNDQLATHLVKQFGCRAVSTVVPGSSLTIIRSTPRPKSNGRKVVFMGTLFRFSGLDDFLACWSSSANIPRFELHIIGGGEQEEKLKALVESHDLEDQVKFCGFVPFANLLDTLSRYDAAILPFQELDVTNFALPGKVFQYIASGLPVVSTRLSGLMTVVDEGDGIMYRPMGESFLGALTTLLDDDVLRTSTVERGQKSIDRLCDWTRALDQIEVALQSLKYY